MAEIAQAKYELSRGVILTITPLTAFMQRALNARAAEMHPEPDRAPYELEVEDALVPGTKTSAEHSQEWLQKMQVVIQHRLQAGIGLLLDAAVTVEDRDALLMPYRHAINAFKDATKHQPAGAAVVSDFVALLLGVLAEETEVSAIVKLAKGATPLTDAEIVDGFRFFRSMVLQRSRRFKYPVQQKPQDIQAAAEPADRPDDDRILSRGAFRDDGRSDPSDQSGKLVRTTA